MDAAHSQVAVEVHSLAEACIGEVVVPSERNVGGSVEVERGRNRADPQDVRAEACTLALHHMAVDVAHTWDVAMAEHANLVVVDRALGSHKGLEVRMDSRVEVGLQDLEEADVVGLSEVAAQLAATLAPLAAELSHQDLFFSRWHPLSFC